MKAVKFKNIAVGALLAAGLFGVTSCVGDLDVENINPQQTTQVDFDNLFNKIYANMSLTGQKGPDGSGDLDDIDEGTSSMIRQIWNANELSTDEMKCSWGDTGIPEFNHNSWSDAHPMMNALYYRLTFGTTLANSYLENVNGDDAATLTKRAEARFMRCLYYYYLMDLYGSVPLKTTVTNDKSPRATRTEMFSFIESELKDICGEGSGNEVLADAKQNTYGRADKAAAWVLLSRLYLNAEVYTGTAKWNEAMSYADKALNSGYSLCRQSDEKYSAYARLFMGDNDTNGAQNEIILPALFDGDKTQSWGGSLFLVASTTDGSMTNAKFSTGTSEAWGGNRAVLQFAQKFTDTDENVKNDSVPYEVAKKLGDDRALFYPNGHTMSMDDESNFKSGWGYVKFNNTHTDGSATHHVQFVDIDFPMIRLAEAYLNYAEADAHLNGGLCSQNGISKINDLRTRANATTKSSYTLNDICDEWSREFGGEGLRRTTLIRFGYFGGQSTYKWQWMGGNADGSQFDSHFNVFAIPSSVITSSGIEQNTGY